MISGREEAHGTGAFNAPQNIKNGLVAKKLSPKNLGVSNEVGDTVYKPLRLVRVEAQSLPW